MDARQIIIRPIVTEKSTVIRDISNQYSFRVIPRASKGQITSAIEELFDVRVTKIRTISMQGKMKRLGRNVGRKASWKKAIVTLAEGDTIDFFEGV
ncbi:MAG: 50S ribosomal protein L23 [Candidatus Fermentibacteraceae bacterium]|nr:50S ribosomal protein L23 [Candidatus Fermentibacteraceae bacterium]